MLPVQRLYRIDDVTAQGTYIDYSGDYSGDGIYVTTLMVNVRN